MTTDQLKSDLRELDSQDRVELIRYLIDSLHDDGELRVDPVWEAELDRRVEEMGSGKVPGIPAHEVIAEIREKYS
jgi:putative addiction module component (TIGR02574 family)